MVKRSFFDRRKRILKMIFFDILGSVLIFLFLFYVVRPFIFPRMPTSLEIYEEAYEKSFGHKPDIPDYLKNVK